MLQTENIKFAYPALHSDKKPKMAVDGISMDVANGEFIAIVGHNGSGKSTLAKHFNALLLPTDGRVLVLSKDTKDVSALWDIRQTVGMVFQNPDNQIVANIVEEDVAFGPENLGVEPAEIRQRVDWALSAVEMSDFASYAPHMLSGGQKQRVAIAGILAMKPACIVLDEPTAMLDPSGRAEVLDTIRRLNKEEGITVILITHFMQEAAYADRVFVMDDGHLVLQGTPREVFSQIDKIRDLGLDVPQVTELAIKLKESGLDINTDVIFVEELVEELCRLQ